MKLGRAIAVGAVLWAVALPFTAGTALADGPASTSPVQAAPSVTTTVAAPPRTTAPMARPTVTLEPTEGQVRVRPAGAPETGGGPAESGPDLAVVGGAGAVVAVAAGGALVLLRRRAGVR